MRRQLSSTRPLLEQIIHTGGAFGYRATLTWGKNMLLDCITLQPFLKTVLALVRLPFVRPALALNIAHAADRR